MVLKVNISGYKHEPFALKDVGIIFDSDCDILRPLRFALRNILALIVLKWRQCLQLLPYLVHQLIYSLACRSRDFYTCIPLGCDIFFEPLKCITSGSNNIYFVSRYDLRPGGKLRAIELQFLVYSLEVLNGIATFAA